MAKKKAAKKKSAKKKAAKWQADGSVQHVGLDHLHLDHGNPRFGGRDGSFVGEDKVVDEIIGQHSITDVLSSISKNGYFESEPLVGAINCRHGAEITVLEGNRRLTACLVIAGDQRASRHKKLHEKYADSKVTTRTKFPVQVYDWNDSQARQRLLPYLGIRHIVGASQWDSFAKAAWVAETLEQNAMTLEDIKSMIGDTENFTDRIVEGYYFVLQVLAKNAYDASDSLRGGRGSFQEFPFSWVYTALGYKNVREFVGLPQKNKITADPVEEDDLDNAGALLQFMFGGQGQNASIDDSRKIGKLARAIAHEVCQEALSEGASVEEALENLKPVEERIIELLRRADKSMGESIGVLSGQTRFERSVLDTLDEICESMDSRISTLLEVLAGLRKPRRRSRG